MDRLLHKQMTATRRSQRVRELMLGTADRPRLTVHISNLHVSAQIIDDIKNVTLVSSTSVGAKLDNNLTIKATWVGEQIAAKAKKVKVNKVVLDRGPKKYHGRIKALADAARAGGLEF